MVRFWGYSGDVGSVRFLPSGDVKSTYISRVKATSPESNHTPPEVKNHSGDVKNRFWLYRDNMQKKTSIGIVKGPQKGLGLCLHKVGRK